MKFTEEQIIRFHNGFTIDDSGCWMWKGAKSSGYGSIRIKGKTTRAHRMSYELHKGDIPYKLVIDHLCGKPACVNPQHLEAVSQYINVIRGQGIPAKALRRTACARGHEYTKGSFSWSRKVKTGRLSRRCLVCARDKMRVIRAKKKIVYNVK